MKTLTEKQKNVHAFLISFIEKHAYPPTMREIGDQFGLTSRTAVRYYTNALERKGFIRAGYPELRAIQILKNAEGESVRLKFEKIA